MVLIMMMWWGWCDDVDYDNKDIYDGVEYG